MGEWIGSEIEAKASDIEPNGRATNLTCEEFSVGWCQAHDVAKRASCRRRSDKSRECKYDPTLTVAATQIKKMVAPSSLNGCSNK